MNKYIKIIKLVILIELVIIIAILTRNIIKINNKVNNINDKIKEIELDYKFLKYNKDELDEINGK